MAFSSSSAPAGRRSLAGKVAVVTGGSRGIGEATVRRLAHPDAERDGPDAVRFLAPDESRFTNAQIINVDGGSADNV